MVQTNVGDRLCDMQGDSQKQSMLIAPPFGRGARTQDHLEALTFSFACCALFLRFAIRQRFFDMIAFYPESELFSNSCGFRDGEGMSL